MPTVWSGRSVSARHHLPPTKRDGLKATEAHAMPYLDWDDYSLHAKVQATPVYQKFMDKAKLVFDLEKEPPVITHHEILPFPPASEVRESPVTELVTCTIDAADDRTAVDKAASGLMSTISAGDDPGSAKATAVGWSVETHDRPEAKGGKVLGLGMLIGWNSVEDHMKMRETKQFGEAIGLVRPHLLPSVPKWEMCHVAFKRG